MLASSYPARYPVSTPAAQLLLPQQQLIHDALAGKAGNKIVMTEQGRAASAAQPVWNMQKKPIGAVYVTTARQGKSAAISTISIRERMGGWASSSAMPRIEGYQRHCLWL